MIATQATQPTQTTMGFHSEPITVRRFSFYKSKTGKRLFMIVGSGIDHIPNSEEVIEFFWLQEYKDGEPINLPTHQNKDAFERLVKEGLLTKTRIYHVN